MKKELFQTKYLLIVLIVLVILGFTALLFQNNSKQTVNTGKWPSSQTANKKTSKNPPSDLTTGWKTFKDEKIGFEIKYPPKYKVDVSMSNLNQTAISFDDGDLCSIDNPTFYININNDILLNQKIISSTSLEISSIRTVLNIYELSTDDHCIVIGKSKIGDRLRKVTSFKNLGVSWSIGAIINKTNYNSESLLFDQILSTFKFTN